jgi:Ca-activated chloride channel family protein
MKVQLLSAINDPSVDPAQTSSQRQLEVSISALSGESDQTLPVNLCLILDQSGSMYGQAIENVNQAVRGLLAQLKPGDRISIIAFAGTAEVLVPNQIVQNPADLQSQWQNRLKGTKGAVSQAFLLTDGRGESGLKIWKWQIGSDDNSRCLEFAQKATNFNLTINTLGFGNDWNQDLLEKIADAGGGTLAYIENPEQAVEQFNRLLRRIQSVGLTNAHLLLSLIPNVRLAELKPIAQVAPDTIELPVETETNGTFVVRLGDLMQGVERVVLANIYLGQLPAGQQVIGHMQIRYDDPGINQQGLVSPLIPLSVNVTPSYQPQVNPQVQRSILSLAKYRQTKLAEVKLQQGDRAGAATMLQTAAKTALQIGDRDAATVLQTSATRLEAGQDLSEADRKKTRIVSKTILRD